MRISDWSSDVCSSDLERDDDEHRQEGAAVGVDRLDHHGGHARGEHAADADHAVGERGTRQGAVAEAAHGEAEQGEGSGDHCERSGPVSVPVPSAIRSEEARGGNEWGWPGRYRWSAEPVN